MPGLISESFEAGVGAARYEGGYDDVVTFGRVLAETLFCDGDNPVELLLAYFEKPHKWEGEYRQWLAFGGTLDQECLDSFKDRYKDTSCSECRAENGWHRTECLSHPRFDEET